MIANWYKRFWIGITVIALIFLALNFSSLSNFYSKRAIYFLPTISNADRKYISFSEAIKEGDERAVEAFIRKNREIIKNEYLFDDMLPLQLASNHRHIRIVKMLISAGLDVNSKDVAGMTAIHWARDKETAEILISHWANVNEKDRFGATPLHYIVLKENKDLVLFLLSEKAIVDSKGWRGRTPLHMCADDGNVEIAKMLIKAGSHINAREYLEKTPLHVASMRGNVEMVKLLIDNGADVNAVDIVGCTPLHYGASQGYPIFMEPIIDTSLKPRYDLLRLIVMEDYEFYPYRDYVGVAKHLIDNGAKIDKKDKVGRTPLSITVNNEISDDYVVFNGGRRKNKITTKENKELRKLLVFSGAKSDFIINKKMRIPSYRDVKKPPNN